MTDPNDARNPRRNPVGARIVALLALLAPMRAAAAPTLQPPFDGEYTLVELDVPGVAPGYGGLTFVPGDPNTVVVAGRTETVDGLLYAIAVTRDATGSIDGFAGDAVPIADAYGVSAGVAYGPGGVLFYSRSSNEIGEIKPASTTTNKVVSLAKWSSDYPGGLTFVPSGLAGQGKLKFVGFESGQWWSAGVIPDNKGTFDVFAVTAGPALDGGPEGFDYVLYGSDVFPYQSIVVGEFYSQTVSTYYIDENGDPLVDTRREVITGFDAPDGVATDPLTGDFLITNYYGGLVVLRSVPLPTTSTTSTTSTTRPTTTTTSTRPTTTIHPTTTSSTTSTAPPATTPSSTTSTAPNPSSTTSSTSTAPPTTTIPSSTTSTTAAPSTTSSSSTSTPASSTTTTTAVPVVRCPHGGLASITCRSDGLRMLARDASDDLGPFRQMLVARLETATAAAGDAERACAGGNRTGARNALDRLVRQMTAIRSRLRTKRARKLVPHDLAGEIGGTASALATDARALRGSLVCP